MQSLYAYFTSNEDNVANQERDMWKHINAIVDLNLVIVALLIELVKYADNFYEDNKKKYFPSFDDLNPNRRFVDNYLISEIRDDNKLMDRISKVSAIWLKNDHDIIRKLFKVLFESELYANYISSQEDSISVDQRFIVNALNQIILNNELVHHILEEESIYWIDDLPFIATIIIGQIKEKKSLNPATVFKDKSDRIFALNLFYHTINNNGKYEEMIERFSKNWDLERISVMDQLFLKMAFAEILYIKDMPIKVSMNEYIEISKYYGSSKSKLFINGLLDNAVKTFIREGEISEFDQGLV